jgi:hypothetical protein
MPPRPVMTAEAMKSAKRNQKKAQEAWSSRQRFVRWCPSRMMRLVLV